MDTAIYPEIAPSRPPARPMTPARSLRKFYFVLEAINATATAYYFNYLFFYMRDHFGFGNRDNLMLTATHGFIYMFSAWSAGRFALRHGYHFSLRLGFSGMAIALSAGALVPRVLGFSHGALAAEVGCLVLWTVSMCLTWPTLQALLSRGQPPSGMPRTAGMYNMVWAAGAAFANLTGGVLFQKFGAETLFWVPAGMHVIQVLLLLRIAETGRNSPDDCCARVDDPARPEGLYSGQQASPAPRAFEPPIPSRPLGLAAAHRAARRRFASDAEGNGANGSDESEIIPPLNPRPIAKARTFLFLAWLANPFAYMAINGVLPVMPKLAANLELDPAQAGLVSSVWFWVRLGAFVWFYFWPGWHYRFRWLLTAFIALAGSFTLMLLSPHVWMLIAAEIVFGLAVGLIYYSSLFYSMDVGESTSKRGGIHEAAIGLGVCVGPAIGVVALYALPGLPNAGIWAISSALLVGLVPFSVIKRRGARKNTKSQKPSSREAPSPKLQF